MEHFQTTKTRDENNKILAAKDAEIEKLTSNQSEMEKLLEEKNNEIEALRAELETLADARNAQMVRII